jgi:2-polyprenyl-3-methyl-5-hydroxy-6-metoxy-1,4-benzoquinol methylase
MSSLAAYTAPGARQTSSIREVQCPGCLGRRFSPLLKQQFLSLCEDCGLTFDNPRPTAELISAFYNQENQYDGWLKDLQAREELWARRMKKMRRHARRGSLLDVGAGIGQFLDQAKVEYGPVSGVEISSTAITIAKKLYDLEIALGDIHSLTQSEQFDNLTAFHVLEHVHQPLAFLKACHRLLKDDGRLFLAVPNDIEALTFRIGLHSLSEIRISQPEIHLSHFTARTLSALLKRSGFEILNLSLDPFWVGSSRQYFQSVRYLLMGTLERLTRINLYPTIWAVARKG